MSTAEIDEGSSWSADSFYPEFCSLYLRNKCIGQIIRRLITLKTVIRVVICDEHVMNMNLLYSAVFVRVITYR